MSNNETERFLKAEESAQEILIQLEELREETITYKNATQEIEKAREGLINLTDQLQDLGKSTVELIRKTNEFGLEGIQEKISNIENYAQAQDDQITKLRDETVATLKDFYASSSNIYKDQGQLFIKSLEENKRLLEEKNKKLLLQIADLTQKLEQHSENQENRVYELTGKLDELKDEVKADNKFIRSMLFLVIAVVGVSFVFLTFM